MRIHPESTIKHAFRRQKQRSMRQPNTAFSDAKDGLSPSKKPPFAKQTAADTAHKSLQTPQHPTTHAITFAHEKRPYSGLRHFILRITHLRKPIGKQCESRHASCGCILSACADVLKFPVSIQATHMKTTLKTNISTAILVVSSKFLQNWQILLRP